MLTSDDDESVNAGTHERFPPAWMATEAKSWCLSTGHLEALAEKGRRFIGDTDDFVGCLPIEFEIELRSRPAITPVGEMLEFAAPHWPLRKRRSFDGDAHARRLAWYTALLSNGFGVSDDTARDEALAALVLAREYENRVTLGDQLAAIHRLVGGERETPRPRIDDLRFDRIRHDCPRSKHQP